MREHGASLSFSLSLSLIERERERKEKREKREERRGGKRRRKKKVFFRRRETRRRLQIAHGEKREFFLSSLNTVPFFFLQLSLATTSSSLFFLLTFSFFTALPFTSPTFNVLFSSIILPFFSLWIFLKNTGNEKKEWCEHYCNFFFSIAGDMILDRFRVTEHIKKKKEEKGEK